MFVKPTDFIFQYPLGYFLITRIGHWNIKHPSSTIMRSFIIGILTALVFIDLSVMGTQKDAMRIYRKYRLHGDRREISDNTGAYSRAPPSNPGSSYAGYLLNPGVQRNVESGNHVGSIGHGFQLTDSSPVATTVGSSIGYNINYGIGSNLASVNQFPGPEGSLSSDQSNFLIPAQERRGPVTFGVHGGGATVSDGAFHILPMYIKNQGLTALAGSQAGGSNSRLALGSVQTPIYNLAPPSSFSGSHGFSLAPLGPGGSQALSFPLVGSPGGYLLSASSLASPKYSLPISPALAGYYNLQSSFPSLTTSPLQQGGLTFSSPVTLSSNGQSDVSTGPNNFGYSQLTTSHSNLDEGSTTSAKFTPASSDGSTYAPTGTLKSTSDVSSPGIKFNYPTSGNQSPNYSATFQSESVGSPNYSSSNLKYQSPISTYSDVGSIFARVAPKYVNPLTSQSTVSSNFRSLSDVTQTGSQSGSDPDRQNLNGRFSNSSPDYTSADNNDSGSYGLSSSYSSPSSHNYQQAAYSSLSPRYLKYQSGRSQASRVTNPSEYDTISYSVPTTT